MIVMRINLKSQTSGFLSSFIGVWFSIVSSNLGLLKSPNWWVLALTAVGVKHWTSNYFIWGFLNNHHKTFSVCPWLLVECVIYKPLLVIETQCVLEIYDNMLLCILWLMVRNGMLLHCQGVAHSSEQLASKQGIAAYSVQPVSGTVDTAKCRY